MGAFYPQILSLIIACAISTITLLYVRSMIKWRARTRGLPLPPGPTPLPVIGNMLGIPKFKPWRAYRELCAKYGEYPRNVYASDSH